ncbi:hypothetical protein U8P75_12715 [Rhizobium beringeri]|nr:hypothetical protein U8P75_12715 [Rhizobium beringeri]
MNGPRSMKPRPSVLINATSIPSIDVPLIKPIAVLMTSMRLASPAIPGCTFIKTVLNAPRQINNNELA